MFTTGYDCDGNKTRVIRIQRDLVVHVTRLTRTNRLIVRLCLFLLSLRIIVLLLIGLLFEKYSDLKFKKIYERSIKIVFTDSERSETTTVASSALKWLFIYVRLDVYGQKEWSESFVVVRRERGTEFNIRRDHFSKREDLSSLSNTKRSSDV